MPDPRDHLFSGPAPIEYVPPPPRLGPLRRLLARLPGRCSYCGRRYRGCQDPATPARPLLGWGRCCPDGHEGYLDYATAPGGPRRVHLDFVAARRAAR